MGVRVHVRHLLCMPCLLAQSMMRSSTDGQWVMGASLICLKHATLLALLQADDCFCLEGSVLWRGMVIMDGCAAGAAPRLITHTSALVPCSQAVVLSESVCRRLPGCMSLCADIMRHAIDGDPTADGEHSEPSSSTSTRSSTTGVVGASARQPDAVGSSHSNSSNNLHSAGGTSSSKLRAYRAAAEAVLPAQRVALASALCAASSGVNLGEEDLQQVLGHRYSAGHEQAHDVHQTANVAAPAVSVECPSQQQQQQLSAAQGSSSSVNSVGLPPRAVAMIERLLLPHWPSPVQQEWVTSVVAPPQAMGNTCGDGSDSSDLAGTPGCCSRMYLQHAEGEMRIALTLVSEADMLLD